MNAGNANNAEKRYLRNTLIPNLKNSKGAQAHKEMIGIQQNYVSLNWAFVRLASDSLEKSAPVLRATLAGGSWSSSSAVRSRFRRRSSPVEHCLCAGTEVSADCSVLTDIFWDWSAPEDGPAAQGDPNSCGGKAVIKPCKIALDRSIRTGHWTIEFKYTHCCRWKS